MRAPYTGCSIVRTRSGKWALRFRWVPPDGKPRHFSIATELRATGENRRQLEAKARVIGAELKAGTFEYARHFRMPRGWWEGPTKRRTGETIEHAMERWIADRKKRGVRHSRTVNYEADLRNYVKPKLGPLPVAVLEDAATLRAFQLWLVSEAGESGKGVSEKTAANAIKGTLKAFARDQNMDLSAFAQLRWERYVPKRMQDPLTSEERDRILRWYNQNRPWPEYVLYRTAFDTGMRPSELLGLDVAHFDRATSSLVIRQTRYRGVRDATKTRAAERSVELSPAVAKLIKELVGIKPPEAPIFAIGYGSADKPWRRCLAKLGIRPRSPYQTKHTYATLSLLDGESPSVVASKLGISLGTLEKHYAAALRTGRIVRRTNNRGRKTL